MPIEIINSTQEMHLKENCIAYARAFKNGVDTAENMIVKNLSDNLFQFLCNKDVCGKLKEINKKNNSSKDIQNIFLDHLLKIGFQSEKRGLFKEYLTPGLRPDYYLKLDTGGILLEVERGKTITNNMDLLDIWKCHICEEANHLFLVVPIQVSHTPNGFNYVVKRIESFFKKENYINIDSVSVFGY